jgi:eukaryotic-like serine/threonine-protein kinase
VADTQERLQAQLADRYRFERELGAGGMATVFLARDLKHDREVAIKVLHPDLAATIGGDRFEREIKLAAKLQHPHILGLYDSGQVEGLLFYVMPFVKGESLRDRIAREGQLPIDDAIQITLEVADALGYAHAQGIVHRDIKPENVLLSGGHALVADFGIARAVTEGTAQKLTQTGMAVGTPVYMAPEQSVGEAVGPTADLYSLGCVLYEMLAGEPPFTGKNAMALMARHAMESVPSIRIVRTTVPEEVEDAIFAAMAKVPADRPQSAAQFSELLGLPLGATAARRAAIRATATRRVPTGMAAAYQAEAAEAPVPWWKQRRVLGVAAGLLLAVAGFAGWRLSAGSGPRGVSTLGLGAPVTRVAVLYFQDLSPDGELSPLADGLTEALIGTLSEVRTLSVVSRNGVAAFRGAEVPRDSIARALGAGTLIEGSVEPEGRDRVRVTTRLYDGTGADVNKRASFVVAQDRLFTAEDSVAREVSRTLREWIGQEVQVREGQAGTSSLAAWTLMNRAERLRKDAEAAARSDPARAAALFGQADTLLAAASREDDRWIEPLVLRGEIAYQRSRLPQEAAERTAWIERGKEHAAAALRLRPSDARATALRGTLRYGEYRLAQTADPAARSQLLASAKQDLETAVRTDPTLASAYAQLSFLNYDAKDVPSALVSARNAYEADAYLSIADLILFRLFWASYDLDQFSEARKWCDEGRRRFPRDYRFTACGLWMMLTPDARPDIPEAWRLAAAVDSLAPPAAAAFQSHLMRLVVGGVIGRAAQAAEGAARAALADSADRVLQRARADREVDPRQELVGYEAVMRTLMGEYDLAIQLLTRYTALNPDHSFQVGGNIHWWWRSLRSTPGFQAVMAGGR